MGKYLAMTKGTSVGECVYTFETQWGTHTHTGTHARTHRFTLHNVVMVFTTLYRGLCFTSNLDQRYVQNMFNRRV